MLEDVTKGLHLTKSQKKKRKKKRKLKEFHDNTNFTLYNQNKN